jgi:hypothetical protein
MCLAKAFIRQDGEEKVVMDEIAHVTVNNGRLVFSTIFGQQVQFSSRDKASGNLWALLQLPRVKSHLQLLPTLLGRTATGLTTAGYML